MRRFLRHVYAVRRRLLGAACVVATGAAVLATLSIFSAARASDALREEQLAASAQANRPVVLREHAGWDGQCEAIAHPALYLDEPPRHGSVCTRVENVTIKSLVVGTESQCIGREVRGVRLIYRPDAGFTGGDGLRYAVQYPSVRRAVAVRVTVTAGAASGAVASPVAALPLPQQSAGLVPPCADAMF